MVLLPEPLGPRTPRISPERIVKLISWTAKYGAVAFGQLLRLEDGRWGIYNHAFQVKP